VKHIFKTISKFTIPILTIIVLLFCQAMCDLALPDYTSKIVNIGIQQGGIENAAIKVVTEDTMNQILLLSEDDEKIKSNYELISKNSLSDDEYEAYKEKYPLIEKEPLYILKDISKEEEEELSSLMSKPLVMIGALSTIKEEDIDKNSSKKLTELEPSLVTQMAIPVIQMEYKKIKIDTDEIQISYMISVGIKMLLIAFTAMILTIGIAFLSAKVGAGISKNLRSKTVSKTMTFSNKEFEEIGSASLITRCTNDITQIQMFVVMLLRMVFYAPIIGFGALGKVSGNSMSWVIAVAVLAILSLVIILFGLAIPKFKKVQTLIDKLNLVSRETLTGLSVIRAFSNEKHEEKRFDKANTDLTKVNIFIGRVMTIMMPTMMFIMNGVSILIIWVGADRIDAGTMQVGTLMAFITYTMQIITSFLMLSMMSFTLPRALISMRRIAEVLNTETSVKEKEKKESFDSSKKGVVEFKDVYFRYPDAEEDVLRNISFIAKPGTTTAFIGSTGSGKSTLINLIPRFFDVTGGKILVDGIDIRNANIKELRSKIGYVPQKGNLFTGTIKSNIAFGNEKLTEKEILKAAEVSQSLDFINEKENRLDEKISQGGTNVSGGQKQRLSIARALAINPDIYIFDDSFSALDYKTDKVLRDALSKYTKNGTILIVAQRIGTIMNADQIVVLDEGKVVGIGTHKELLENCFVYKEIALSQFGEEELENA